MQCRGHGNIVALSDIGLSYCFLYKSAKHPVGSRSIFSQLFCSLYVTSIILGGLCPLNLWGVRLDVCGYFMIKISAPTGCKHYLSKLDDGIFI